MRKQCVLLALLLGAVLGPARAQVSLGNPPPSQTVRLQLPGGVVANKVKVPDGSTSFWVEVFDDDLVSNDKLYQSSSIGVKGGAKEIDLMFYFYCIQNQVMGANGTSGEAEAEIFLKVHFNGGKTVTTPTKIAKCN